MRTVFLHIFAGSGRLSHYIAAGGQPVISVDTMFGDHFNILNDDVFKLLVSWVQSHLVAGIWCGTPCSTFSRSRRAPAWSQMPRALRSSCHIGGLPDLQASDRLKVVQGNLMASRAATLLRMCRMRGLPGAEENPFSSWLWDMPGRMGSRKRLEKS